DERRRRSCAQRVADCHDQRATRTGSLAGAFSSRSRIFSGSERVQHSQAAAGGCRIAVATELFLLIILLRIVIGVPAEKLAPEAALLLLFRLGRSDIRLCGLPRSNGRKLWLFWR